jgi:tetratricopeptide (TPR) repeat protein
MRRLSLLALCFLALCLFASLAGAQAPPSFREGVIAFEREEWAKAETALRAAVAANPNESEGTVQLAGSWFETYVPHYFLARTLAKQGKCAEALNEFAASERQGVTPSIPDFARHLKTRDGCGGQAKTTKPPRTVGEVTVPFGEEAPPRAPAPKTDVVKPSVKPVTKPAVATPPTRPSVDPRTVAEKARLAAALTEYLQGHYEEAARLLDPAQFHDRAAVAEAALFRAASHHALYRIGGGKDEALRRGVEADVQMYRALRGNARPDPRMFPPSFIAMTR